MLRKLGCLLIALGLAMPALAAEKPGSISGYVRAANGSPQMGAMVEVLGSAFHTLRVFTDEKGFYNAAGLIPGIYNLKVSAPYFLPALRQRVGLHAGTSMVVNVTLSTLFEAVQFAPARGTGDDDDWKWVLRSSANRPVLRMLEDGTLVPVRAAEAPKHDVSGSLALIAGSAADGFSGTQDMSTTFAVEKSIFSAGTVSLRGNVGYGDGPSAAVLRASYSHRMANGSLPEIALTVRTLPSPYSSAHNGSLQALALTTSDDFTLGDVLELKFGSELQTIQFLGKVTAFRPFGSASLHLSPNTIVSYGYATSEPNSRMDKGFESAPADLSESQPRVTVAGLTPSLEHAHHQELSVSRRIGKTNLQAAVYSDRVTDPALTGVGEFTSDAGEVIPDPFSGTFTYRGKNLDARGLRLVLQRKMTSDITATLDYSYGGALDLGKADVSLQDARQWTEVRNRHSLGMKVSGTVTASKTRWIASYGWVSGSSLTPVDMFNASPGQTDPYLSFFLRQPIPGSGFIPSHMDALIDIRNLLAEGYVPLMGNDGRTVYLVQAARSVRGGVAFTF